MIIVSVQSEDLDRKQCQVIEVNARERARVLIVAGRRVSILRGIFQSVLSTVFAVMGVI